MPLGYKREVSFPRPAHGRGVTTARGTTTASGAGGLIAAAGVALDSDRRHWQTVARPGDGKVVRLAATARTPRRWAKNEPDKDAPSLHKLMPWASRERGRSGTAQLETREREDTSAKPKEPTAKTNSQADEEQAITGIEGFQPHLQQRRRSVEDVIAGMRSDLLSHSVKPTYRYRAGVPGVWDTIQENATSKAARMRRALMEAAERGEAKRNGEQGSTDQKADPLSTAGSFRPGSFRPGDHSKSISEVAEEFTISPLLTVVVLFFHAPCNPLNMDDILILKRAKLAIEAYHQVAVAGALVIPFSTAALQRRFAGEKSAVLLPFDFRMEMAQSVIETAEQTSWILTDNCEDGCLANAPGSLMHYFAEYTRSRLYDSGFETKVLEVKYEDCLRSDGDVSKFEHRVAEDPYGMVPEVPKAASVRELVRVVVECPKQVHCRELLRRSIWLLCRGEETSACCDSLRRLLGTAGAEMIQRWASRHQEGARHSKFRS